MARSWPSSKIESRLVLVGGGHSHVQFLKSWRMHAEPGVELVLISPQLRAPYSGMLPARLAGWCSDEDMHFELHTLCAQVGAIFVQDEVVGMDLRQRRLHLRHRPALSFDRASINVGITPDLPRGAFNHPRILPLKPIANLLANWSTGEAARFVVVGAGSSGFEIANVLAAQGIAVELLEAGPNILAGHSRAVRSQGEACLRRLGVRVRTGAKVIEVSNDRLLLESGENIDFDRAVFATAALAPSWIKSSGLPVNGRGFLQVDAHLQAIGQPRVFAAGDCIAFGPRDLPKAGVFAVREGPILAENLRRSLKGHSLLRFQPQTRFLTLLTSGSKRALMSYGPWSLEGAWLWRWKDRIDRRFMQRFSATEFTVTPTEENTCGGCGSKVGATILNDYLQTRAKPSAIEDVGWLGDRAFSVDGFRAFSGDLFLFGQVSVGHAMNDLYAAGIEPDGAMVQVQLPPAADHLVRNQLEHLMAGVDAGLKEANAQLLNAHTSEGQEVALSVSVTGPGRRRWSKSGLHSEHVLILTKALGTGILLQAAMRGGLSARAWTQLSEHLQLSHAGLMAKLDGQVLAATDISGFGLLGHLSEMLQNHALHVELDSQAIVLLPDVERLLNLGLKPHLLVDNRKAFSKLFEGPSVWCDLLCDPQTHGPLLLAVAPKNAESVLNTLFEKGFSMARKIGRVTAGNHPQVSLVTK